MRYVDMRKASSHIKENEGYRRFVYEDSKGIPTIGIGFNLEVGFSEEECDLILRHRIRKLIVQLAKRVPVYLEVCQARKIVLLDMAYNLGIEGLLEFKKMLAAIDRRDYELAAKEMLDSRYAIQVTGRAQRNAKMMETGEWYES